MLDPFCDDAKRVVSAAREVGFRAAGGRSLVFGQIGVDDSICPENCAYCAFATCNSNKIDNKNAAISDKALIAHLEAFNEARVDAVSLMGTAALPFENYLNMIKIARDVLSSEIRIIVNYRDMLDNEISALEQAGATHVYHAVRIREGKITGISPERRKATIKRVQKSNMQLMNGVEPVWEPFDEALANDVADAILEAVSENPQITGACGLCSVENSRFEGEPPAKERVQLVASVLRLVAGETVPFGCVGGISWVDAGADPRERGFSDSKKTIISEVKKARSATIKEGWKQLSSPF